MELKGKTILVTDTNVLVRLPTIQKYLEEGAYKLVAFEFKYRKIIIS
jgi:hypothetical protein